MFGKKSSMSANEKFVTSMGKKAGNLGRAATSVPKAKKETVAPAGKLPSADAMKRGVKANQNPPQSKGKANTFKTTGEVK